MRLGFLPLMGSMVCCLVASAQDRVEPPKSADSPKAALEAYRDAIERRDIGQAAHLTAGSEGDAFRRLAGIRNRDGKDAAGPWVLAKQASDRLDRALSDKKIELKNPFKAGLDLFADVEFAAVEDPVVEAGKMKGTARIKFGPRGKAQEETVVVEFADGTWRVGLPVELARHLPAANRLPRLVEGLDKLADALNRLADEVEKDTANKLTKGAIGVRLLELFQEARLAELLG